MAALHNPDDDMSLVGEDLRLDGEDLNLEELPNVNLPDLPTSDDPPAAKKACFEGPSAPGSSASPSGIPMPAASDYAAPHPSPSAAPTPLPASASAAPTAGAPLGAVNLHTPPPPNAATLRNLRRPRPGGPGLVMPRRRLAVVTLLMPEAGAETIRADLIARISAMLKPHFFRCGSVPEFEAATGDLLRVPRRSYARLSFTWPSEENAEDFKRLFPRSISLNSSRSVLLKVFEDRFPDFTAAKAAGAATLSLRNVPPGYTPADIREFLLHQDEPGDSAWLAELRFFHRTMDPYEEVYLPIFSGIPLPPPDDPSFSRIPAVIPFEDASDPALLNISSHKCGLCGHNHRDGDHEIFPIKRKQRLNNKVQISVAHLQQTNVPSPDGRLLTVDLNFLHDQLRLIAIYAPPHATERRVWWRSTLTPALDAPSAATATILAGDFNSIVLPEDRNRALHGHERSEACLLETLFNSHSLSDSFRSLHPTTTLFSYIGRPRLNISPPPPPPAARLDRIYISSPFLPRLKASLYLLTPTVVSDHSFAPLCSLAFTNPVMAPRPWRLSPSILQRPYIARILDTHLPLLPPFPSPQEWDLWKNHLTLRLKCFSNQERRRVTGTMEHLKHLISRLQIQAACLPLCSNDAARLCNARQQLAKYEASKTAELALKAKLKVEGHREMGISSLLAGLNSRIKASLISSITLPNGQTTSLLPSMTAECTRYFQTLYSGASNVTHNPSFWQHIPRSSLPDPLAHTLQAPFSLLEIGKALGQLSRGKTPGPDGLPGELFRLYRPRFTPAFHSLLGQQTPSTLPPSMLSGRTVLIPKKSDSTLPENLRPITLMNADYKILALCLTNRLQRVLPLLIHPSQTAFIKHRKIGDTINDTLDIMDWAQYKQTPLIALTVDFRKAYDLVNRPFLLQALSHLGLPPQFVYWVRLMYSNTATCIAVNNLSGPLFPVRSGVRQGCPLAPLLFVCVIEFFHRYMSLYLPGFPLAPATRRLMACYADDVTLFLSSNNDLGLAVDHLSIFAAVSGETPNWNKCSIIPFNISPLLISSAGPIPIRAPHEAERILGIFIEQSQPGNTTWTTTLDRIQRASKYLASLRATATCRKTLASVFLNSTLSFPGRFQPAPTEVVTRLDVAIGNFLSSSRYKESGLAVRLIPNRLLYNSPRHGGLGAIAPSTQIRALSIQRALRRFGASPSEEVARTAVPLPFGTHALLAHPAILKNNVLPPSIPSRALAELRALLPLAPAVLPPPLVPLCLLGEPTAFNRFLLKPNGKPFGLLKKERFLLLRQIRLGHIFTASFQGLEPISTNAFAKTFPPSVVPSGRRVLRDLIAAIPPSWLAALRSPPPPSASPGDWFIPTCDLHSPPTLALQTISFTPPHTLSMRLYRVLPNRLIERTSIGSGTFHIDDVTAVHTQGRWVAGPLHTGAGLGARLELLQEGIPSLASLRLLLYSQQPLDHDLRWTRALSAAPPPFLPNLSHEFLCDQPSLQRDLLFRFYTRSLPSGARFQFAADRGRCQFCTSTQIETLSHIFFCCRPAPVVITVLGNVANCHLGCSPSPELLLFPLNSRPGQSVPWSLLVGAAAKTLWNARYERKFHDSTSSHFETLQLILAQFLIAFKIFMWRRAKQGRKKQQRSTSRIKTASRLRFIHFDSNGAPSIHPDLRVSWLLGNPFSPP
ncbi:unnamed protein product [Closterium sp. Yama58-4]|nr:unnamed protein product [Closterium sp. Yama58-4]